MKIFKVKLYIVVLALFFTGTQCEEELTAGLESNDTTPADVTLKAASASNFNGVNWSDKDDNYENQNIIPSGLNENDSWSTMRTKAQDLYQELITKGDVNSIRVGINPKMVYDPNISNKESEYFSRWIGIVQAANDKNVKIIIANWERPAEKDGKIDTDFWNMWDVVINRYKGNGMVYFEIINEPYAYTKKQLRNLCAQWVNKYTQSPYNVPRGRILVPGRDYSAFVKDIASDSRFNGCLFSQHIYPWWGSKPTTESAWKSELRKRVGNKYKSRTIVTEWGAPMTPGIQYDWNSSNNYPNNRVAFMIGVPNQINDWNLGSMYWPGIRDGDDFRMFDRNGTTLTVRNTDGLRQMKWSYK